MASPEGAAERSGSAVRRALRWVDLALGRTVEGIAMLLMAIYTSLCFYQVVVRFVVDAPSTWTEQLTRALMIWSVYLGAVALFRRGLLISIDFVHGLATGWFRYVLDAMHFLAALAVLGTASFYGFQLAWRVRFQILSGVEVSIAWAYLAVPVGTLLCTFALIARHVDLLRQAGRGRSELTD